MRLHSTSMLCFILSALALGGCASPDPVTYVDPNDDASYIGIGGSGGNEPFVTYGADVAIRDKAIVRIRGVLAAARTVAPGSRTAASALVGRAIFDDLPTIEPHLTLGNARLASALRTSLEQLRDRPPADDATYNLAIQRLAGPVLTQAEGIVVPIAAGQDPGFRAAVLAETITDAANTYEEAIVAAGDPAERLILYRVAYGMLLDARTRGLVAIPERDRRTIQDQLKKATDRSLPSPTPPAQPRRTEQTVADLTAVADLIASSAEIDTTFPSPDATTPDKLRAIKRSLAASLETAERGGIPAALAQLRQAATTSLASAAPGLAAVDPLLLTIIERGVIIGLPAAVRGDGDSAAIATELDFNIDEAISLVESELEALRDPDAS